MIYETVKQTWSFDDCIVEEKEGNGFERPYFDVHIKHDGIKAHQYIMPYSDDDVIKCREALNDGESPLWIWDDGCGYRVGDNMRVSRSILRELILKSEYRGGENGCDGDAIQYRTPDEKKLVIYTNRHMDEDEDSIDELVEAAEAFAIRDKNKMMPSRWESGKLLFLEDE